MLVQRVLDQGKGAFALTRWCHRPEEIRNKLRDELLNAEV